MAEVYTVAPEWEKQRADMRLTHDLMGGTQAMRRAAERYIEKGSSEDRRDYEARVHRTKLFNIYRRTLNFLRGQVFQKQIVVGADGDSTTASEEIFQKFSENVDRMGRNITAWSGDVFRSGLNDGVTFCLVDYPQVDTREADGVTEYRDANGEWRPKTQAADMENAWTPYFVHVRAEQVIDARLEWQGGRPYITHFRYREVVQLPLDEWSNTVVERIRVFRSGVWEIWQNSGIGNTDFVKQGDGRLSLSVIPVAVFMPGDQRTPLTAEPALQDLAELNARHWTATSGQYALMEFVRRPVWFGRGLTDDKGAPLPVGPGRLIATSNEWATLQSVGVDSASVEAGRQELQDLESAMAVYGLQLLQPKTGAITATESARDAQENNSTLQNWALQYQDFLENCFKLVGTWWGLDDGPSIKVNTDFARATNMQLLLDMTRAGILSNVTFLELAKQAGLLPDEFSADAETEKMAREVMTNQGPSGVQHFADALRASGGI